MERQACVTDGAAHSVPDGAATERCQSLPPHSKQSLRPLRGGDLPPRSHGPRRSISAETVDCCSVRHKQVYVHDAFFSDYDAPRGWPVDERRMGGVACQATAHPYFPLRCSLESSGMEIVGPRSSGSLDAGRIWGRFAARPEQCSSPAPQAVH